MLFDLPNSPLNGFTEKEYIDAPIHIVYSSNQDEQSATGLNGGLTEEKVLESFA